jgi:hypothetical protein
VLVGRAAVEQNERTGGIPGRLSHFEDEVAQVFSAVRGFEIGRRFASTWSRRCS